MNTNHACRAVFYGSDGLKVAAPELSTGGRDEEIKSASIGELVFPRELWRS